MKIDIGLWYNIERLRERVRNFGSIILSICAMNGFYAYTQKGWLVLGLNVFFFITTLPLFLSYGKFQKEPPRQ